MSGIERSCPGRDGRLVTPVDVTCASCGYVVELFSDEPFRRCPQCRAVVRREAVADCATWCPSAGACSLIGKPPPDRESGTT
jgi:hypothetical protein